MDQEQAAHHEPQATPIFNAYRRGYDPEQVDRYVADQQRRLDEALKRASVAERRLGAAVGQLRELNKRVATLESQEKPLQAPALDTLGDRIQRILTEAWEGAYAIRQSAEQEVQELRAEAEEAAQEIIALADERAKNVEEDLRRRVEQQKQELEQERSKAVGQISYLHEQKKLAMADLLKLRDVITSTLAENLPPNLAEKYRQHMNKNTGEKVASEDNFISQRDDEVKTGSSSGQLDLQRYRDNSPLQNNDNSQNIAPKENKEIASEVQNDFAGQIRPKPYIPAADGQLSGKSVNEATEYQDLELALTMPIEAIEHKNITPHIDRRDISELVRRRREANKRLAESTDLQDSLFSSDDDSQLYLNSENVSDHSDEQAHLYDFSSEEAGDDES